ncbi:TlpA family protein disulfide reductase [Sphingobacterium paucimobilis]|nr:redoxin family protein [Sphingobacterium paucimobilis]
MMIKKIKIGIVLIYIMSCMSLAAQQSKVVDLSQRLNVGDIFNPPAKVQLMRSTDEKIDWKALEDKVVLLDLFETTCGTCIQIMPHLQELQKKHVDIFKVFVVTPQDKQTMVDFFKKNKYLKEHKVNLPVIYGDNYLRKLFPYKSIPQAILLYKGKVQAITSSGFINSENIQQLHKEGKIALPLKDDFGKASLINDQNIDNGGIKAGVIFSGYQNGVDYQPWRFELDSLTGLHKSSLYNASMYGALLSLASQAKIKASYVPRFDRVIWNVKDSTKYENFSEQPSDVWLVDHAVSYERYDMRIRTDSIQARIIMDDFVNLYGVRAYESTKKMPCLVLKKCPVVDYDGKDVGRKMTYVGTAVLAGFLDYTTLFPPVVDEAKVETRIQIGTYATIEDLNQQLAAYGVKGQVEQREIKVLVIEEVD